MSEQPLDDVETEAAHLFAGMCMSRHMVTKDGLAYTCTRDEGHDGLHKSVGPDGQVYAAWVHY